MVDKELSIARRIVKVFPSKPRIGNPKKGVVWLSQTNVEREFKKHLVTSGVNICLDGPTGTGKSSLALTMLERLGISYSQLQITRKMDWKGFCRRIIESPHNRQSSLSAEVLASLEGVLPKGSIKLSLGSQSKPSDKYEFWDKIVSNCDEADICRAISQKNAVLMVDDFEKASEGLVARVADMCKLLTQSFESEQGKVLVVGTGDIFRKLYASDPALEERLKQFSLGTLPTPEWSWKYLQLGFEALGLWHPANSKYSTKEENLSCMIEVHKACDGLFKGLTYLGREICYAMNPQSKTVKAKSIMGEARRIPTQNYKLFRRKFPEIFSCVEGNPAVRSVLQHLWDRGIGQIHDWNDIDFDLGEKWPSSQVDNAIGELIQVGFLVRTGKNGETLFVKEPVLAHTLGVVISHPEQFHLPKQYTSLFGQYKMPFLSRENIPSNSIDSDL